MPSGLRQGRGRPRMALTCRGFGLVSPTRHHARLTRTLSLPRQPMSALQPARDSPPKLCSAIWSACSDRLVIARRLRVSCPWPRISDWREPCRRAFFRLGRTLSLLSLQPSWDSWPCQPALVASRPAGFVSRSARAERVNDTYPVLCVTQTRRLIQVSDGGHGVDLILEVCCRAGTKRVSRSAAWGSRGMTST
jgi:hypothetical protein